MKVIALIRSPGRGGDSDILVSIYQKFRARKAPEALQGVLELGYRVVRKMSQETDAL
jgi:hypothetical protein